MSTDVSVFWVDVDYEQLLHHSCMHRLLPEDLMQIEKGKRVLILVPILKRGEATNPFSDLYDVSNHSLQSSYPTVIFTNHEYIQLNGFVASNPEYDATQMGVITSHDIKHKFGTGGASINGAVPRSVRRSLHGEEVISIA